MPNRGDWVTKPQPRLRHPDVVARLHPATIVVRFPSRDHSWVDQFQPLMACPAAMAGSYPTSSAARFPSHYHGWVTQSQPWCFSRLQLGQSTTSCGPDTVALPRQWLGRPCLGHDITSFFFLSFFFFLKKKKKIYEGGINLFSYHFF